MSRTNSSRRWLREHQRDRFVKRAAREGYRSRAAYKLAEIDARDTLFAPGHLVVDLGAAPGGWSQVARERTLPAGRVVAIDILAMEPIAGVEFIQGDFRERETLVRLERVLGNAVPDLVLSDMAPNMSGIRAADQARAEDLMELALAFAEQHLVPGGTLLVKAFHGAGYRAFLSALKGCFRETRVRKPEASRSRSMEIYLLGRGFGI